MGAIYIKWWLEYIFRNYKPRCKTSGLDKLIEDILWEVESAIWDVIELFE